jgi:hypothetical protein
VFRPVYLASHASKIAPAAEGLVTVPREPTPEMVAAAYRDQPLTINAGFAQGYRAMIAAAPASPSPAPVEAEVREATHRHKKRGSEYVLIGFGKMQADNWFEKLSDTNSGAIDMREVAIYRSVDDGSLWVRPREEFEDGRFTALSPAQPGAQNNDVVGEAK